MSLPPAPDPIATTTASLGSAPGHASALVSYDRDSDLERVLRGRKVGVVQALIGVIVTILLALAVCFLLLLVTGKDAVGAYQWLLSGPFSRSTRIGRVLLETTTLSIIALSVAIPFRAGLMSLGAEGQIYLGALASTVVSLYVPMPPGFGIVVPVLAAMTAGAFVALIPGWMKAYLGANELVSTLMLNAILVRVYAFILTNWLTGEKATSVASEYLPNESIIPTFTRIFGTSFDQANLMLLIVPVAAVTVWLILKRTPFGYEVRMSGSNARFARYGGIKPRRVVILAFLLSGAIAGIAGAHVVQGVNGRALLTLAAGAAFDGIMIAILARNNPLVIPVAAFLYAYLKVGGDVMEQELSIGTEIVDVIQALIVLLVTSQFVLALVQRRRRARLTPQNEA